MPSDQPFSKGHGTQLLFLQLPPEALASASTAATADATTGVDFSRSSKPRRDGDSSFIRALNFSTWHLRGCQCLGLSGQGYGLRRYVLPMELNRAK